MVSAGTILILAIIIGFVVFGGLQLSKDAVAQTKATVEKVRAETQKKIESIKSDEK